VPIAFLGDVHGCALHALAGIVALQRHRQVALDAVIQVGDLGAFPSRDRHHASDEWYVAHNPAQAEIFRVLDPDARLTDALDRCHDLLGDVPVRAISGNHEDHDWLAARHRAHRDAPVVPIDPLGTLHHVADGTVLELAGLAVAFLGGIDAPGRRYDLDAAAIDTLLALEPGSVDVLVTHDGPWAMCRNWQGRIQGSRRLTALIERLRPRIHVSGHYHHVNGPRHYGQTASYALAALVDPKAGRFDPTPVNPHQQLTPGGIGLLDTTEATFEYVTDGWLGEIRGDHVDLGGLLGRYSYGSPAG